MTKNCWEIVNCPFNGNDPQKSKCDAYKLQKNCWEYDWISYYNQMPESPEKKEWLSNMLKYCPECPVYKQNSEVTTFLEKLRQNKHRI